MDEVLGISSYHQIHLNDTVIYIHNNTFRGPILQYVNIFLKELLFSYQCFDRKGDFISLKQLQKLPQIIVLKERSAFIDLVPYQKSQKMSVSLEGDRYSLNMIRKGDRFEDSFNSMDQSGANTIFKQIAHKNRKTSVINLQNIPQKSIGKPRRYTVEEVKEHCTRSSSWVIYQSTVYDITFFKKKHPGGDFVLQQLAGQDVTNQVKKHHNWVSVERILQKNVVGWI